MARNFVLLKQHSTQIYTDSLCGQELCIAKAAFKPVRTLSGQELCVSKAASTQICTDSLRGQELCVAKAASTQT